MSGSSVAQPVSTLHRANGESAGRMAKASLPKGENPRWQELGACLDEARAELRWTLDRLARELDRDDKQVGRWLRGEERPQIEVVIGVGELRAPFCMALARRTPECEVETIVRIRRVIAPIVALVLVALLTGCASTGAFRASQVAVVGTTIADLHSPRLVIARGGRELNPVGGQSWYQQLAV